jgi:hypothetical protein
MQPHFQASHGSHSGLEPFIRSPFRHPSQVFPISFIHVPSPLFQKNRPQASSWYNRTGIPFVLSIDFIPEFEFERL